MTRANKALVVMVLGVLGIWGCAQGPSSNSAAVQERIKALEGKCVKLEDDYRAVATARDQLRKKLAGAEEERARIQQELNVRQGVLKERDELKVQLNARIGERDAVQGQFEQFRKSIKTLLGQVEANSGTPAAPAVSTSERANPGRS